jgi:4-hydroxybenzoate polyprenyltransferase
MKHLIAYAQLVRLPNTFTSMADIFLGAVATGLLFRNWYVFLFLLACSTCLYWSGMIWNDYFDIDQDRKERPGRPLASGRVPMAVAAGLGIALMGGGLLFAFLAGLRFEDGQFVLRWRSLIIATLLIIAIFLYDGAFKATWAGPVLMGLCRLLNIMLGLSIYGGPTPAWGWPLALIIGIYIAGVTWFARSEARESSQAMLIAAALVILFSLILALSVPALVLQGSADQRFPSQPSFWYPYLLAAFGGFLGLAVLRAIQRPEPMRVQPAVKRAILGLVLLDALLASAFVGSAGLLLAVLLIPGIILGRWLYST